MGETEHRELAELAFQNIDTGYWQGCETSNGGWEDGEPWSEAQRQWRLTARDYQERFAHGDWELTEGMVRYADWDLCRELAWIRGWCPARDRELTSSSKQLNSPRTVYTLRDTRVSK